jgi:hypothetical protein
LASTASAGGEGGFGGLAAPGSVRLLACDADGGGPPPELLRDIARALLDGSVPVWMPYRLQHDDLGLPADWGATSDALAARLAERMGCGQVALVKSCPVNATADLDQLAQDGITDPTFASVVRRAGLKWAVYGAGDEGAVAARLGCANGEGRTNGSDINGRA